MTCWSLSCLAMAVLLPRVLGTEWYQEHEEFYDALCHNTSSQVYSEEVCRIRRECPSVVEKRSDELRCTDYAPGYDGLLNLTTAECKFGYRPNSWNAMKGCGTLWCCLDDTEWGDHCCVRDEMVWVILSMLALCAVVSLVATTYGCCRRYKVGCFEPITYPVVLAGVEPVVVAKPLGMDVDVEAMVEGKVVES
mmetsp:Transcript_24484/g.56407  ORF Transcript_24484/g.56407 Transcript_24484/m.56407 type:complete len:193 (-) Transcript_24484:243-821(-)